MSLSCSRYPWHGRCIFVLFRGLYYFLQDKGEAGAFPIIPLRAPDPATVGFDDFATQVEADAGAPHQAVPRVLMLHAKELVKHALAKFAGNTRARVGHGNMQFIAQG